MPELPEVETVKRLLSPYLTERTIVAVDVRNGDVIARPEADDFKKRLTGQTIDGLSRRGKFLTFVLRSGDRLTLHLRMTGCLIVVPAEEPLEKHTHLLFRLDDGKELRYEDTRRFGRFWLIEKEETDTFSGVHKLGTEPFAAELTADYLKSRAEKRNTPVKEMLLDQTVVAGIGNIYADEILFVSGIYPAAKCADLSDEQWQKLAKHIPEVMLWGIRSNETTPEEYLAGKGKEYRNTPYLKVYGREGLPCPTCGTLLEKISVGGRGSCYCPQCQKKR